MKKEKNKLKVRRSYLIDWFKEVFILLMIVNFFFGIWLLVSAVNFEDQSLVLLLDKTSYIIPYGILLIAFFQLAVIFRVLKDIRQFKKSIGLK